MVGVETRETGCPPELEQEESPLWCFLAEFEAYIRTEAPNEERIPTPRALDLLNLKRVNHSKPLEALRRLDNGIIRIDYEQRRGRKEYFYNPSELTFCKLALILLDEHCPSKEIVGRVQPLLEEINYPVELRSPLIGGEKPARNPRLPENDSWALRYGETLVSFLRLGVSSQPPKEERKSSPGSTKRLRPPLAERDKEPSVAQKPSREQVQRWLAVLQKGHLLPFDSFSPSKIGDDLTPDLSTTIIREVLEQDEETRRYFVNNRKEDVNLVIDGLTYSEFGRCLGAYLQRCLIAPEVNP